MEILDGAVADGVHTEARWHPKPRNEAISERRQPHPLNQPHRNSCQRMPLNEQLEYLQSSLESLPESLPCYDLWDFEEDASFIGRDREFWFGDDIDLGSPFLYSMLSDERRVPGPEGVTPAVCEGVRENELTDEEWENM